MFCKSSLSTCEFTGMNVKVANYSKFPFESNLSMVDTITSKKEFKNNRSNYYRLLEDEENNPKSSSVVSSKEKPSNPANPPVPPQPAGAAPQPKAERYGTDEQLDNAEMYDYESDKGSNFENFSNHHGCYSNSGNHLTCSNSSTDKNSTTKSYTCSFPPYGDSCRREKFADLDQGDYTRVIPVKKNFPNV